MQADTKAI